MIKTCSDERMTYMKKLVMLVTVVLTVAMAAVCFAAGDGNDLNKQQKIVDKFVAALTVADDIFKNVDFPDALEPVTNTPRSSLIVFATGFSSIG